MRTLIVGDTKDVTGGELREMLVQDVKIRPLNMIALISFDCQDLSLPEYQISVEENELL